MSSEWRPRGPYRTADVEPDVAIPSLTKSRAGVIFAFASLLALATFVLFGHHGERQARFKVVRSPESLWFEVESCLLGSSGSFRSEQLRQLGEHTTSASEAWPASCGSILLSLAGTIPDPPWELSALGYEMKKPAMRFAEPVTLAAGLQAGRKRWGISVADRKSVSLTISDLERATPLDKDPGALARLSVEVEPTDGFWLMVANDTTTPNCKQLTRDDHDPWPHVDGGRCDSSFRACKVSADGSDVRCFPISGVAFAPDDKRQTLPNQWHRVVRWTVAIEGRKRIFERSWELEPRPGEQCGGWDYPPDVAIGSPIRTSETNPLRDQRDTAIRSTPVSNLDLWFGQGVFLLWPTERAGVRYRVGSLTKFETASDRILFDDLADEDGRLEVSSLVNLRAITRSAAFVLVLLATKDGIYPISVSPDGTVRVMKVRVTTLSQ